MKYSGYLAGAALAAVANAHTTIWNLYDDDVDQGVGNVAGGYIRYPPNNNPVKDITSSDMTCNVNNVANTKTVSVAAGSKLTLEWHHDSNSASDDIIASVCSHSLPTFKKY
jgi:cellulase